VRGLPQTLEFYLVLISIRAYLADNFLITHSVAPRIGQL